MLKRWRRQRGLGLAELAAASGASVDSIKKAEAGEPISREDARKLSHHTRRSMASLGLVLVPEPSPDDEWVRRCKGGISFDGVRTFVSALTGRDIVTLAELEEAYGVTR